MDFKFFRVVRIIGLVDIELTFAIQLLCLKQIYLPLKYNVMISY